MAKTEDSKQITKEENTGSSWAKAFQFSPDITKVKNTFIKTLTHRVG